MNIFKLATGHILSAAYAPPKSFSRKTCSYIVQFAHMLGEIIFAQFAELYAMKMVNAIGIAANAAVVSKYSKKLRIWFWKLYFFNFRKGDKSKEFVHCKDCNMCVEKNKTHACYNSECPICLQVSERIQNLLYTITSYSF